MLNIYFEGSMCGTLQIPGITSVCQLIPILPPKSPRAISTATRGHWLPTGAYRLLKFLSSTKPL